MNFKQAYDRFKAEGPFDVELADDTFAMADGYGEKGMRGTVTSTGSDSGYLTLTVTYSKFREFNRLKESPDYDGKTATEANMVVDSEELYGDVGDTDIIFQYLDANTLFDEWLKTDQSITYIRWLENTVTELRGKP